MVRAVNSGEKTAGDKVSGELVSLLGALVSFRLPGPQGESWGQGIRWTMLRLLHNL